VLTFWGTGAAWDDQPLASLGGAFSVDTDLNTLSASVPTSLVGADTFRAYAASGVWDHNANQWAQLVASKQATQWQPAGGGTGVSNPPAAFNVAFRSAEAGSWFDDNQAAALSARDISAFHADVDLNAPNTAGPLPAGYFERVYRSSIALGSATQHEGVSDTGI